MKDLGYTNLLPSLDEKVVRRPYKRASKLGRQQAQQQENHIEHHNIELKLPPIESPKSQNFSSNEEFGGRLKFFIDFGFKPNGPLTYEELMKFQKAKKRSITLSDFMSKKVQRQILSSDLFTFTDPKKELNKETQKKRNSLIDTKARKSKQMKLNPARSCQEFQSDEKETLKRNKQQELQKINQILNSCDDLLQKTPNNSKLL